MTRYHATSEGNVPFNAEEEALADAEEAMVAAGSVRRNIIKQIAALETSITERMKRESLIGSQSVDQRTGRTAAQQIAFIDEQIAALRAQL